MVKMNTTPEAALEQHRDQTRLPLSLNNARELGGILLPDGCRVRRGLLLRTTRLFDATEEDIRLLRESYRLSLIIDMRETEEILRAPDPEIPGVKWVHAPVIDFEFVREKLASRSDGQLDGEPFDPETAELGKLLDWMTEAARRGHRDGRSDLGIGAAYASYLAGDIGRRNFGFFFHELAANENGATLWHCHTGKDRTGIAAGLILDVLGADWDTILRDYETSNLFYRPELEKIEEILRERGVEEELLPPLCGFAGVHAPMLKNAWKYMEQNWGGAVGYLTGACGVTEEELCTLRDRFIED